MILKKIDQCEAGSEFPKESHSKDLDINFKVGQFPSESHFYLAIMFPIANWGKQTKEKIGEEKREINRV